MPTYDYHCPHCDTDIELFHGLDTPAPRCSVCGELLAKQFKAKVPVIFKGKGFYCQDTPQAQNPAG